MDGKAQILQQPLIKIPPTFFNLYFIFVSLPKKNHTHHPLLQEKRFALSLIDWYQQGHRALPWRATHDPYKIWLAEIILQQTRVVQGMPYYNAFITQYPTLHDLAAASETEVLRTWQGLGYYSRARNLHTCARLIVDKQEGVFPNDYKGLLQLPGIGPYTAAAIASIAFREAVPVVDGNVLRVLARIFGITSPINSSQGKAVIQEIAQQLISIPTPDVYNQAIMEFGAVQCTPQKPACDTCIFHADCIAYQTQQVEILPKKDAKVKIKKRYFHYLVLQLGDKLLMKKRPKGDIWQGLYDFYLVEADKPYAAKQLSDELLTLVHQHQLEIVKYPWEAKHILTHRVIYASFFHISLPTTFMEVVAPLLQQYAMEAVTMEAIQSLPKSVLICKFLNAHM